MTYFLANAFPNILAVNVPNSIERNLSSCYFASFLIAAAILFISNPDSSSDLTIFIISFMFSFELINPVVPDP